MKIWFGKHNGEEVSGLPTPYLKWLCHEADPPTNASLRERWKDLLSEAEDELDKR